MNFIKTSPLYPFLRNAYIWLRDLPQLPAATLHPWRRESIRRLAALKNIHKGRRAFIIGNGPSLKNTDLSKLKGEITFGLNRIYLMFPELGFSTTYLVSINDLVIEQCAAEMLEVNIPKFLSWRSRRFFKNIPGLDTDGKSLRLTQPSDNLQPFDTASPVRAGPSTFNFPTFLYTTYDLPRFSPDARGRIWEGATVTNVALQLAFHMGIQQVILIGVDHNFTSKGPANATVISEGDDPNHFSPSYFGKGFRWQLPDLETSEIAYRMARQSYEKAGRKILDATVGGKLTIFNKADYNALF